MQAAYQSTLLQSLALNSGSYTWEYSGRRPIKQTTPLQGACAIEQMAEYQGYFVANAAWRRCGALLGEVKRRRNGFYEVDQVVDIIEMEADE